MKKRIFINIHYLEIGGAERALLGLLSSLNPDKVDIDLFVNQHTGEFMPLIPEWVNLLPSPDMHNCYDKSLIAAATKIAEEESIKLQYGVYVGGTGPTFETQAEYRYFKAIGGDAAGMSTVPEVIVARHMSIPVFGVSVITNCGLSDEVGDHEDVQRQGKKAGVRMELLFRRMIKNL